jgi:outer membrane protein assembly factor BamB
VSRRAEDVLFQLAGETAPSVSLGLADAASRRRCREAWLTWWSVQADKVDLSRLHVAGAPLGLTLYALYDSVTGDGRVLLTGADGKTRWEIDGLQGPNDARLLPGGRVLIAERNAGRVTERDTTGRILWEKRVESGALSAQRLPGGNTLIASWTQVLEVTPAGKTVWEYTLPAGFRHVGYQKNGRILAITAAGQLIELDRSGKLLRSVTPERHAGGATYWASAEQSGPVRYLVALGSSRRVVEVDEAGKVVWEVEAPNAVFATRLASGNTLVCCFEECQVIEVDREGKEVARRKLAGRPFTARRY